MKFFTKTKKAVIAIALCLLMIMPFSLVSLGALSVDSGLTALKDQFKTGTGPTVSGLLFSEKVSYTYYSPVKNSEDTTKYPLVVFIGETVEDGSLGNDRELSETSFPLWSSAEYQARFYNAGGAFLLFIRKPKRDISYSQDLVVSAMQEAIVDFAAQNVANLNDNRIYVVSWGNGCQHAIKLIANNSETYKALVMCSTSYAPTAAETTKMADVPVWIFSCKADSVASYDSYGDIVWNNFITSIDKDKRFRSRFTTFETFTDKKLQNHATWEFTANDAKMEGGRTGEVTVNGENKTTNISTGVIDWLSKFGSDFGDDCTCECHHAEGFAKLIWLIRMLLSMMLKLEKNHYCVCGDAHW